MEKKAKRNGLNVLYTAIMLFAFCMPVFASCFEKNPVVYIALGILLAVLGYGIYNRQKIVLTKTFFIMLILGMISFAGILFFSDKGRQFYLGALFLMCAAVSLAAADYREQAGRENAKIIFTRLVYCTGVIYAMFAILHQVFIESSFFGCRMDIGSGSSTLGACLMVVSILSCFTAFGDMRKHMGAAATLPLMAYVFAMSKSFIGYLFAAVLVFYWTMTQKHRKVEALFAMVTCVILAALSIVTAMVSTIKNPETFNGGIKGLVSIIGVGNGGYNAVSAVTDKGYIEAPTVFYLLTEAFGIIGLAMMGVCIACCAAVYLKKRNFSSMAALILSVTLLFSSSDGLTWALPLMCMYYAVYGDGITVKINKSAAFAFAAACIFFFVISSAYVPYALGDHFCDMGQHTKGADFYAAGAKMEMFAAKGWEKAYEAQMKGFDLGEGSFVQKEYIENAMKFNEKNYKYKKDLALVYEHEGDYLKTLEIWDEIMARHDKEYLYPEYAQKIINVMANCPVSLDKTESLYNSLGELCEKAKDGEIVLLVNDAFAVSQQYYVNAREGNNSPGDMFQSGEEIGTEAEYESGTAEG